MDEGYKNNQSGQPSDDDTPFPEPDDIQNKGDDTHQQTDTNVDSDEAYHYGIGEASNQSGTDVDDDSEENDIPDIPRAM